MMTLKKVLLAIGAVAMWTGCSAARGESPPSGPRVLDTDPREVAALLEGHVAMTVIDVNPRSIHDASHVPTARWARFDAMGPGCPSG